MGVHAVVRVNISPPLTTSLSRRLECGVVTRHTVIGTDVRACRTCLPAGQVKLGCAIHLRLVADQLRLGLNLQAAATTNNLLLPFLLLLLPAGIIGPYLCLATLACVGRELRSACVSQWDFHENPFICQVPLFPLVTDTLNSCPWPANPNHVVLSV